MSSVNKVILVGNLGKDPEVRHIGEGVAVANFSLATTESYWDKTANERREQTEWHNIVLWRGLAEVAEKYLKKGNKVYIEGRIRTRSYEDKEGQTRYITEIVGDNLVMLGGKRDDNDSYSGDRGNYSSNQSSNDSRKTEAKADVNAGGMDIDDDLPF